MKSQYRAIGKFEKLNPRRPGWLCPFWNDNNWIWLSWLHIAERQKHNSKTSNALAKTFASQIDKELTFYYFPISDWAGAFALNSRLLNMEIEVLLKLMSGFRAALYFLAWDNRKMLCFQIRFDQITGT